MGPSCGSLPIVIGAAVSEEPGAGYEIAALNETVSVRSVSFMMSAAGDVLQRRQVASLKY
jgi:hypothetical protein